VAHRLTGSVQDARDVVQDTWLRFVVSSGQFEARADVRTWLTRIAVNCSIDHIQAQRRETAHGQPASSAAGWRAIGRAAAHA
jgi:RNA polymerase sigma-70 factor (ECF subfamily)